MIERSQGDLINSGIRVLNRAQRLNAVIHSAHAGTQPD